MDRRKRIIDCTPPEIILIGKQLIDYYIEKANSSRKPDFLDFVHKAREIFEGDKDE